MMSLSVFTARDDRRLLDRLELRIALVLHLGRLDLLSCRRAPSAESAPAAPLRPPASVPGTEASTRDRWCASGIFLKSSGSVGVANVHGPVEVRRREPAAGDEEVDRAGLAEPEDVALGVADPEQLRAGHRQIARRAAQQNQLRRRRADEHLRRARPRACWPGSAAFTSFQLSSAAACEARRQLARRLPRPLDVGGAQPALVVAQVERLGRRVLEQIPVGVDGELEVVVLDRTPDRIAVEVDEHRRRRAVEDHRRIGLHARRRSSE